MERVKPPMVLWHYCTDMSSLVWFDHLILNGSVQSWTVQSDFRWFFLLWMIQLVKTLRHSVTKFIFRWHYATPVYEKCTDSKSLYGKWLKYKTVCGMTSDSWNPDYRWKNTLFSKVTTKIWNFLFRWNNLVSIFILWIKIASQFNSFYRRDYQLKSLLLLSVINILTCQRCIFLFFLFCLGWRGGGGGKRWKQ